MVEALVAGHICLDIIPAFAGKVTFDPGRLIEVGPALMSTGGAVSNTGQALHKLGIQTRLCGKVSDDIFGKAICEIVERTGAGLSSGMLVSSGEASSYSVVISLSGEDRMFLHAPGCNDTFTASDISDDALSNTKLIHFGYPTLMAKMFANIGEEMESLFSRAKAAGTTTSLDMSLPDLTGPAGTSDWGAILRRILPVTDLFLPNIEELQFMLDPSAFKASRGQLIPISEVRKLASRALELGTKVVGVKLGSRGLYLASRVQLTDLGRATPSCIDSWQGIEIWVPCFQVDVKGTTGAGDATVAGLLMGWLRDMKPEDAARAAVAVGASSCEQPDAISGIGSWDETEARISRNWPRLHPEPNADWPESHGVYRPVT